MNGHPGYPPTNPNYGQYPPATNPPMGYVPTGTWPMQVPPGYPQPYPYPQAAQYAPPPQGQYPPNPAMYPAFPPGQPDYRYPQAEAVQGLQAQNPYPGHYPTPYPDPSLRFPPGPLPYMGYPGPQLQPSQNNQTQFGPGPENPNPTAPSAPVPNAPMMEPSYAEPRPEATIVQAPPAPEYIPTAAVPPAVMPIGSAAEMTTLYPSLGIEQDAGQTSGLLPPASETVPIELLAAPVAAVAVAAAAEEQTPSEPPKERCGKPPTEAHQTSKNYGTILPHHPFDPKQDATHLRKAMKGSGTDEAVIAKILANRSQPQRKEIAEVYEEMFKKELVKDFKNELSGSMKETVRALMTPRTRYLTKCLRMAINGRGSLQRLLVEIYFTSTNAEIYQINEIYKTEFKCNLDKDLKRETPGYFKQIIIAANCGTREENQHVDHDEATADAQALHKSAIGHWGHIKSVFSTLLITRSYSHLRRVFDEYRKISKHTVEHTLKKEMSGALQDCMLLIVECIQNRAVFFAKQLARAIKTMGTDDRTIIRIIVTRSEIDLKIIKEVYLKLCKKSIEQHIYNGTEGDYKKALLEILHTE